MVQTPDERRAKNAAYMREYQRKKKLNNPEEWRREKREWMAKKRSTPEGRARSNAISYAWRDRNPEKAKGAFDAWKVKNPDYFNEHTRERVRKNPEWFLLYNCKQRAKKTGVPFSLVLEDIAIPSTCPVLGIPIKLGQGLGKGAFNPNCPSVDRVIPSLGYVKHNIRVISLRANTLKNNGIPEELAKVLEYAIRETEIVLRGSS